eukprot:2938262-Lingulodinium_polyedra.AAC.1
MTDQDPAQMNRYLISQLCDPNEMPAPAIDVDSGAVTCQNLTGYEGAWDRRLTARRRRIDAAANALERCIATLGTR